MNIFLLSGLLSVQTCFFFLLQILLIKQSVFQWPDGPMGSSFFLCCWYFFNINTLTITLDIVDFKKGSRERHFRRCSKSVFVGRDGEPKVWGGGEETFFKSVENVGFVYKWAEIFGAVFGFCVAAASPTRLLQDTWIR